MRDTNVYVLSSVNTDEKRKEVFQVSYENIRIICSNFLSTQVVEKEYKEQE